MKDLGVDAKLHAGYSGDIIETHFAMVDPVFDTQL